MREFKTSPFGYIVDLDDPETYNYLPNTIKELRQIMFAEIGYAYCYMNFWHADVFEKHSQKQKVEESVKNFTENYKTNYENIQWYKEQIFLFQDLIENMC